MVASRHLGRINHIPVYAMNFYKLDSLNIRTHEEILQFVINITEIMKLIIYEMRA